MRPFRTYLRSLNPGLPRAVWILQGGGLANAFGNGVVLPFVIIYLHNVRGLSLTVAGFAAATNAFAGIISGAVGGALADSFGPRRTLIGALLGQAAAISMFPLIDEVWHALALQFAMGAFSGAFWPSQSSLLTSLTPVARRHAAFAQQRATMNLGVGLGALVGGLIATTSKPDTFTTLFLLDAATFLVFALVLTRVPRPARIVHDGPAGSYRQVLRNRPVVLFLLLNVVFIGAGIVPLVELMPVYAKNGAGVSEQAIGIIFLVNTIFIVLLQLPIAKALEGRRRMPALALMGAIWAVSWLIVLGAVENLDALGAALVIGAAVVIFAVGECLHGTVQGPMVADLAEPHLMGRYMALAALSWQFGFLLGPAVGGALLDAQPVALWLVMAGLCGAGGVWALVLERRIPQQFHRTPRSAVPEQVPGVESRTS